MKYCKDCKHYGVALGVGVCHSPNNGVNIVTGEPRVIFANRNRSLDCGTEARFFEEKDPVKESFCSKIMKWISK